MQSNKEITCHGALLKLHHIGVLITGPSGCGKTDAILSLLSQGHQLIADDSVKLRKENKQLIGHNPLPGQHFLHIRDIGISNARLLFELDRFCDKTPIQLVINIKDSKSNQEDKLESSSFTEVLDLSIPCISLQMTPQRPLALLIDIATRSFILEKSGYNATTDFEALIACHPERNEASSR